MKKLLITTLVAVVAVVSFAVVPTPPPTAKRTPRLEWTANPPEDGVVTYRVYSAPGSNTTAATLLTETAGLSVPVTPSAGVTVYYVTAVSATGLESDFSDPAVAIVPTRPVNLRLTVTLQESANLRDWSDKTSLVSIEPLPENGPPRFWRSALALSPAD